MIDTSAIEQNNYFTNIVDVYIAYDLDAWPRNPTNNFKFKNCLFVATNIVKNSDKEKYVFSGYGITVDSGTGSWSFDNDVARNVIIFGVDSSSSSYSDNCKHNFLILGEGPLIVLMEALDHQKKIWVLILLKQTQNFVWGYIIMVITVICMFMEKKFLNKNINFLTQFCLRSISNGFSATESREVSLNRNIYDFSVDYSCIEKSDILNIHKYLMYQKYLIVLLRFSECF